jgi:hypothetical protein
VDEPVHGGLVAQHEHTRSASSLTPKQAWEDPHKAELRPLPAPAAAASSPRTTSSALLVDPQESPFRPLDVVATEEMRQGKGLPTALRLELSAVELVAAEGAGAGAGAGAGGSDDGAGHAARYGGASLSAAVLQAGIAEGSRARCAGALEVQELPLKAPQSAQRRFEYEVACLRRLQHVNIQSLLGVVVTPKATWMLLEVRYGPGRGGGEGIEGRRTKSGLSERSSLPRKDTKCETRDLGDGCCAAPHPPPPLPSVPSTSLTHAHPGLQLPDGTSGKPRAQV